jgi:hypothetical protein
MSGFNEHANLYDDCLEMRIDGGDINNLHQNEFSYFGNKFEDVYDKVFSHDMKIGGSTNDLTGYDELIHIELEKSMQHTTSNMEQTSINEHRVESEQNMQTRRDLNIIEIPEERIETRVEDIEMNEQSQTQMMESEGNEHLGRELTFTMYLKKIKRILFEFLIRQFRNSKFGLPRMPSATKFINNVDQSQNKKWLDWKLKTILTCSFGDSKYKTDINCVIIREVFRSTNLKFQEILNLTFRSFLKLYAKKYYIKDKQENLIPNNTEKSEEYWNTLDILVLGQEGILSYFESGKFRKELFEVSQGKILL